MELWGYVMLLVRAALSQSVLHNRNILEQYPIKSNNTHHLWSTHPKDSAPWLNKSICKRANVRVKTVDAKVNK